MHGTFIPFLHASKFKQLKGCLLILQHSCTAGGPLPFHGIGVTFF